MIGSVLVASKRNRDAIQTVFPSNAIPAWMAHREIHMLKSYSTATAATFAETDSFDAVVADPAAFYPDPAAVVADTGLTRRQRLHLLTEWAQDLVDRQVAENEGMAPEGLRQSAFDTGLLRQVNTAIEVVEASPEAAPGLITRVWRRLISG